MHVRREENYRQPERHHDECAGENPVGQSDRDDRGFCEHRDEHERRDVRQQRLLDHPLAAKQNRGHRGVSAAARDGLEHLHQVAGALRPVVGVLGETAHHEVGEHVRRVEAQ